MSLADTWAEAIAAERDAEGQPSLRSVVEHIRGAVIEAGYVSRGRITRGLKEAYIPLGVNVETLGETIKEALRLLVLSGDLDELATSAGRGYAVTPPRQITWGSENAALLGGAVETSSGLVRRINVGDLDPDVLTLSLADELGRPEWRSALVDLNSADAMNDDVGALFGLATALAASGERYALDETQSVAVLGGQGRFFGQPERAPSGRWQRPTRDGCYPAAIKSGFTQRYVVLNIADGAATLWEPASRDLWNWVVLGATVAAGGPVANYDSASQRLEFFTPPPKQIERAVLLTGTRVGSWSWNVDSYVWTVLAELMVS